VRKEDKEEGKEGQEEEVTRSTELTNSGGVSHGWQEEIKEGREGC
jgi:hypothetical protein